MRGRIERRGRDGRGRDRGIERRGRQRDRGAEGGKDNILERADKG